MKPQARIQAAIDILSILEAQKRVPMDAVTGDYMRKRRYIGSKDRAAVAAYVYDVMRRWARLEWHIARSDLDNTPRTKLMAFVVFSEGANLKRVSDLFDGSKYAPDDLTEDEKKFITALEGQPLDHADMTIEVSCECPPLYADALKDYFGAAFKDEMLAMLNSATLDLRVNIFKATREKAKESLAGDGVETDETPYSPWGLRARTKAYLSKTKAFTKGWVEIQDEGSQLIAHVCDVSPSMQVLDFCAGGGGKTLALAAAMQRKGRIVAMDMDERRLARGKNRYKKAAISDIVEMRPLSDTKQAKWLKRQKGKFDVVLCDVPCTGTGTWRRNPDMRWTVYGPSLDDLTPVQIEILDRASRAVKAGGKLVYATCSLLPAENEDQVAAFLARNPDFEIAPLDETLGLGTPYMRLTPHRHKTDGFFAAVMVRKTT